MLPPNLLTPSLLNGSRSSNFSLNHALNFRRGGQVKPEIAESAAREKHRKYDRAASFSPLITSCEGVGTYREFTAFQRALTSALAEKWARPKSYIAGWVKTHIQIAIIRAISLRLRGSRKTLRSINWASHYEQAEFYDFGLEDGAAVPPHTVRDEMFNGYHSNRWRTSTTADPRFDPSRKSWDFQTFFWLCG